LDLDRIEDMKKKRYKWKYEYIFTAYELAKNGARKEDYLQALGIKEDTFLIWRKEIPLLRLAIKKGKEARRRGIELNESFSEYIYGHLSPEMKEVYDRLERYEKAGNVSKIEELMNRKGRRFRQRMLIHAWASLNFSLSAALKRCGVPYQMFLRWKREDLEFAQLLDEIEFHKKNFYEEALNKQIAMGDSTCIIFANRTINADRFPEPKQQINIQKQIHHQIDIVQVSQLNLPVEVKRLLLEEVRRVKSVGSRVVENEKGAAAQFRTG